MSDTDSSLPADGADPKHTPYYTVAQAARRLQVSPSTIWRWIDAKKLPAYRVGEKTIRVRKEDLDALIRPMHPPPPTAGPAKEVSALPEHRTLSTIPTTLAGPTGHQRERTGPRTIPLTDEEVRRGLAALEQAAASRAAQLARRKGTPFPASGDLISQIREERDHRR